MDLAIVASCGLNSRRKLDKVDVPRLEFSLHNKLKDAIKFLRQNAQYPDLRLFDDRLFPFRNVSEIGSNPNTYQEKNLPVTCWRLPVVLSRREFSIDAKGISSTENLWAFLRD